MYLLLQVVVCAGRCSYSWYTSTGTFLGSGTSITVSPIVNTTYRVYCTNGGIDGLCFKDVNVFYLPGNRVTNNVITPSNPVGPFCNSGNPGLVTGNTPNVTLPTWSFRGKPTPMVVVHGPTGVMYGQSGTALPVRPCQHYADITGAPCNFCRWLR